MLESPKAGTIAYRLFESLPMMPRFTVEQVKYRLATTYPTANAAVKALCDLGIVQEMTGQRKNRSFGCQAYIALLSG
jgi:predicted transcriptional regulator